MKEEKGYKHKCLLIRYPPEMLEGAKDEQREQLIGIFIKILETKKVNYLESRGLRRVFIRVFEVSDDMQREQLLKIFKKAREEEKDNVQMHNALLMEFKHVFDVTKVDEVEQFENIWLKGLKRAEDDYVKNSLLAAVEWTFVESGRYIKLLKNEKMMERGIMIMEFCNNLLKWL